MLPLPLLLPLSLLTLALGCAAASDPAPLAEAPQTLTLLGQVTDLGGAPVAGALVFVEDAADAAATSDADGLYEARIEADELLRLASTQRGARQTFRLYVQGGRDPRQVGVTPPVELSARGDRRLAAVAIGRAATVRGKVLQQPVGRLAEPAAGALVRLGRARVEAATDGSFAVDDVPAGALELLATAPRYASAARSLDLAIAADETLPAPLVLFPEQGVAGYLTMLPAPAPVTVATLADGGHPFLRSFTVQVSAQAKRIRYSHDPALLISERWRDVPERFDYDFPRDGGNILYYQFADTAEERLSDVLKLSLVLDQYAGTKGIVIENGSGLVTRRNVLVHVDVPPAAFRMRFAEALEEIELRPWRDPQRVVEYAFDLRRNNASGGVESFGQRNLYCQFVDAFGFLSPVYRTSVVLDLFPRASTDVFRIEGGAPQTPSHLVRLDIVVPPNAHEMRIFEATQGSNQSIFFPGAGGAGTSPGDLWLAAAPTAYYVFQTQGSKRLFLQFRTVDNVMSPIYAQTITLLPFQQSGIGLVVNGGAPTAPSPLLDITIFPPYLATAFRLYENDAPGPWLSLVGRTAMRARGSGATIIGIQFKSVDNDESPLFTQPIHILPFPPDSGLVVLDGGAYVTSERLLRVDVFAPANAVAMQVFEGPLSPTSLGGTAQWLTLTSPDPLLPNTVALETSPGAGAKIVHARFRDVNGATSDFVQSVIFYDPWRSPLLGVLIDGGAATTTDDTVTLTFPASAGLPRVRVGLDPQALLGQPFLARPASLTVTLPGTTGTHRVYAQFQTDGGELSPLYFDEIVKN